LVRGIADAEICADTNGSAVRAAKRRVKARADDKLSGRRKGDQVEAGAFQVRADAHRCFGAGPVQQRIFHEGEALALPSGRIVYPGRECPSVLSGRKAADLAQSERDRATKANGMLDLESRFT